MTKKVSVLGTGARLTKLRAMTVREVMVRLRYTAALAAEREAHRRGILARPGRLARALRRDLQGAAWRDKLLAARRATAARFLTHGYRAAGMRRGVRVRGRR